MENNNQQRNQEKNEEANYNPTNRNFDQQDVSGKPHPINNVEEDSAEKQTNKQTNEAVDTSGSRNRKAEG